MKKSHRSLRFACFCLVACGFSATIHAQGYDPNVLTVLPQSVYHGSGIDEIDLMGGNLRITIPLLHIPGRGINTDIQLTYNSKIWNAWEADDPDLGEWYYTQGSASANSMDALGPSGNGSGNAPAIGWGANISRMGQFGTYTQVCQSFVGGSCQKYVEYEDWVMSDGTVAPMADDAGSETVFPYQPGVGLWSFAGDYTRFPGVAGVTANGLSTGYYKDGSKVTSASVTDTNGNSISCVNPSPYTTRTCTDTLGRIITYTYGSNLPHVLQTISYKDSSGTLQTITFSYQTQGEHLPNSWVSGVDTGVCGSEPCITSTGGYLTLASVTLPNGRSYQFQYLPCPDGDGLSTGLVSQVTLPTGGYLKYTWNSLNVFLEPSGPQATLYVPTTRVVSSDGTTGTEKTWTYSISGAGPNQVTDPLGNVELVTLDGNFNPTTFTFKNSTGQALKTVNRVLGSDQSAYNDPNTVCPPKCTSNIRTLSETTILNDTNQQTKVGYTYGSRGNVAEKDEYDWGSGGPGALIRKTTLTYLNDSDATYDSSSVHILDLVTIKNICNSAGTFCSQQTTTFDGATPTSTSNVVSHDYTNYPSTFNKRGNLTQIQNWLNTTSTWLSTTNTYNDVGNLLQTTDPGLHTTSFSYSDNYYNYSPTQPTSAFVSQTTRPVTNGVNHISKSQYYFYSGLKAADCEENFPSSNGCSYNLALPQPDYSEFTYDSLNRSLITIGGDGAQVTLTYNEASLPLSITQTAKVTSTLNKIVTNVYDGLGRVSQQKLTSDPQGTVFTDTTYDALGRVATISNAYRTTNDPGPTNGITTHAYDALSRVTRLSPPDGNPTTGANTVNTTYSGNCSTTTDQAAKVRKSCADPLGRITQVFEPDVSNNLVNETDYTYDVLGNLLTVNQKGNDANSADWRNRTFAYDSLSQLTSATNPETGPIGAAGTITYTYNSDGVLTSKTDGRSVTINYSPGASPIDALHRVTEKTYSDSTPTIRYAYDGVAPPGCTLPTLTIHNGIGKRTGMCDAAGAEAWSWDITPGTGWQVTDVRTTNGVTKSSISQSNFDGSLATLTYPSGRILTYALAYSGTSTASRAASGIDSTGPINYVTSALYSPQGALSYAQNGSGFFTTFLYNSRLQPCWIYSNTTAMGPPSTCAQTGVGNAALMDVQYNFGLGTADNGNVNRITNRINGDRSITYQYDELNRIHDAVTDATSGQLCWGQLFGTQSGGTFTSGYDPWGNLRTITPDPNRPGCSANSLSRTINVFNKLVDSGYSYDGAGNVTADPSGTYVYNAENQLISAGGVTYTYDGDDKRVQKSNGKLYWYGMESNPLDETDGAGNINNASFNEYVFFNGKRIAWRDSSNNVFYYFADHLGTSREIVQAGQTLPCYDADYYPFGAEVVVVTNTCSQNYKFTGKERDNESGLDNFGARYFSSSLGRFTNPDEPFADQSADDPQSWNLYSYVRNNPLTFTDADGRVCIQREDGRFHDDNNGGQSCAEANDPKNNDKVVVAANADNSFGGDIEAFVLNAAIGVINLPDDFFEGLTGLRANAHIGTGQGKAAAVGAFAGPLLIPEDDVEVAITSTVPKMTRWGWSRGPKWLKVIKQLRKGGTKKLQELGGVLPTVEEAKELIKAAGGTIDRIEEGHAIGGASEHIYPHINYTTAAGQKATIPVTSVSPGH